MSTTIFLTGVPGVGKTFLLSRPAVQEKLKEEEYEIVGMGSTMFEVAKAQGYVNDRDDMRNLDRESQMALQALACEHIQEKYVDKGINLIVDTHATVLTKKGYLGTFSPWVANAIDIDYIIILEAKTEDILKRREKDKTRRRAANPKEIREHQYINKSVIASYITYSTAIAKIIDNSNEKTEQAVEAITGIL